ncbi:poliovirus receptor-related protein 2-like, partial [Arapaima gigas]
MYRAAGSAGRDGAERSGSSCRGGAAALHRLLRKRRKCPPVLFKRLVSLTVQRLLHIFPPEQQISGSKFFFQAVNVCLPSSVQLRPGSVAPWLKVDHKVVAYEGQTVDLSCHLISDPKETTYGMSWLVESGIDVAVWLVEASYPNPSKKGRVSFVNASETDFSITIKDVKMSDEDLYTCRLYTMPKGLMENVTTLVVHAKPITTASPVTVVAGTVPAVVAHCTSTSGKPAVQISWATAANGNTNSTVKAGPNNTVTITSEFWLVPTAADNGKDVQCVVSFHDDEYVEIIDMRLSIEYPPEVTIVGYDDDWYVGRTDAQLVCQVDGNPPPSSVTWTVLSGLMPDTVQVKENTLTVLKVDDAVKTTFVCEAYNCHGVGRQQLTTAIRDKPRSHRGSLTRAVIGGVVGIVLLLVPVAAVLRLLWRPHLNVRMRRLCSRGTQTAGGLLRQPDSRAPGRPRKPLTVTTAPMAMTRLAGERQEGEKDKKVARRSCPGETNSQMLTPSRLQTHSCTEARAGMEDPQLHRAIIQAHRTPWPRDLGRWVPDSVQF